MIRRVYAVAVIAFVAVAFVATTVFNVRYTRQVSTDSERRQTELRHRQDQRWCALLQDLDQPAVPAETPRGQALQVRVHQLRIELGCPLR